MTDLVSEDQPTPRPPLALGRRARVAVVIMGCLLSLGVPVVVISAPGRTVEERAVRVADDPAGLGITGAPPASPLPVEAVQATGTGLDGLPAGGVVGAAGAELPGIPTPPDLPDGPLGIPGSVLDAYEFAQRTLADVRPGCHLSWTVLAGIGRIESNHASDGRVDTFGNTLGPILGPRLDGSPGVAAIPDTDKGTLDGDTVWDRAVGPMQFIPSTWRAYGIDGNGDGVVNPNNIYDSTIATGLYLCSGGVDLSDPAQLQAAVFRYNHSATYVDVVLRWAHAYLTGVIPVPSAPGPVPPGEMGNGGVLIEPASVPSAAAMAQTAPLTPTAPPSTATPPPPSATATSAPSAVPRPSPTAIPTPSSSPSPSPSPAETPTPTPTPTPSAPPTPSTFITPSPLPNPSGSPTLTPAP